MCECFSLTREKRTVTQLARQVTNHYTRHPACEISPAGATNRKASKQSNQFINNKMSVFYFKCSMICMQILISRLLRCHRSVSEKAQRETTPAATFLTEQDDARLPHQQTPVDLTRPAGLTQKTVTTQHIHGNNS